jgi:biopolymer transport protein ExbD
MQLDLTPRPQRRLISLTPLIDVVFILLLFFMLASSLTRLQAVALATPAATLAGSASQSRSQPSMLLRIQEDGQLDLNGEPIQRSVIAERLSAAFEREPNLRVLVQPAHRVRLQTTMTLLDQLTAAGIPRARLRLR